ncbi:MAG: diaminopimelate decarboxylase [Gemmatimonadales bacterium]|nr:MAG: diaminopimelate decarboxylase [Gemmatimonadales bacterium]
MGEGVLNRPGSGVPDPSAPRADSPDSSSLPSPAAEGATPAPPGDLGRGFPRVQGELTCRGLSLGGLAQRFGTPLYVYDAQGIAERIRRFQEAFQGVELLLAYSVKANGNLAVLNRIGLAGAGADIVSAGELERALKAGIPASRMVFAGVGKTAQEMERALEVGIHAFHVESEEELDVLEDVARRRGVRAPVGIRVNPDVESPTPHHYTATGHATSKFGIPVTRALELYGTAPERPHLWFRGIDVHIGSQIVAVEPYLAALDTVLEMVDRIRAGGVELEYLDLGGGFGVGYRGEAGLPLERLAAAVTDRLRERGLRLILEPGRSIVGEAGVLLTRVLYRKESGGKRFVITDAGMTELLRPSHYGGWHRVVPVVHDPEALEATVDVVGPVCESGDFLALDRPLAHPEPGDLLAVGTAGAYGFSMASNYNARCRPAEVLVENGRPLLIRRREEVDDLMRGEVIPPPTPPESGDDTP